MKQASDDAIRLYRSSPEVYAAVNRVLIIALTSLTPRVPLTIKDTKEELRQDLIQFFYEYECGRMEQVETLKARLNDALRLATTPPMVIPGERR